MLPDFEKAIEQVVTEYVLKTLPIGLYDPTVPRRKSLPVVSFAVEVLDYTDGENPLLVTAAGPVVLEGENGNRFENYLKIILPVEATDGQKFAALKNDAIRAAYVVVTDEELGTCKEVAALANAD